MCDTAADTGYVNSTADLGCCVVRATCRRRPGTCSGMPSQVGAGPPLVSRPRGRGRSRCPNCLALENLALPARQCFGPPGLKGQEDSGLGELVGGQAQRAALRLYAGRGPRGRLAEGGPVSDTHHAAGMHHTRTCVIHTGARRGRADARVPVTRAGHRPPCSDHDLARIEVAARVGSAEEARHDCDTLRRDVLLQPRRVLQAHPVVVRDRAGQASTNACWIPRLTMSYSPSGSSPNTKAKVK